MAKVVYTAPGLLIADVEAAVAAALTFSVSDATQLAMIDQAITVAGQAAAMFKPWWWLKATATFPTVASTKGYALRTVNTNAMTDLFAVEGIWHNAIVSRLVQIPMWKYNELNDTDTASTTGQPGYYAIGADMTAYLWPTPDAVYTMNVSYIKRHSKITNAGSTDGALIVPAEFHWGVYVIGATWLLKNNSIDPMALSQSPHWVETIRQMESADPTTNYDLNSFDRNGRNEGFDPDPSRGYPL
jgi:hypothetical protein